MKNEKLYMFRLNECLSGAACCIGQRGVLCWATHRAVSGNAACCVGQRTVLCRDKQRAVRFTWGLCT